MQVLLVNQRQDDYKEVTIGFSWSTLILGFMVPLLRGDGKWTLIHIILAVFTRGISWIVMPFFYNAIYIKGLINQGYLPIDKANAEIVINHVNILSEEERNRVKMDRGLLNYLENTRTPWGELFYKVVLEQLQEVKDMKVLDYGSGFGITANALAKDNEVTAIEPNQMMVDVREKDQGYIQIVGGIEALKQLGTETFDAIVCHNVLEYAPEREAVMQEFERILKKGGRLSLVKHNHVGRVMQKAVFENRLEEARELLEGGDVQAANFGVVNYYGVQDILQWSNKLQLEKCQGVRAFWGLQQDNEVKHDPDWQERMFELEIKAADIREYKDIAFYHHLILVKA